MRTGYGRIAKRETDILFVSEAPHCVLPIFLIAFMAGDGGEAVQGTRRVVAGLSLAGTTKCYGQSERDTRETPCVVSPRWYLVGSDAWRCRLDFSPTAPIPPRQSWSTTSSWPQTCSCSSSSSSWDWYFEVGRALREEADMVWCLRTPVVEFAAEPGGGETECSWLDIEALLWAV